MEHFICEIIKPIKRRSSRTALDKRKSMNKVLSVHTTTEQCLYQYLRDGKCYNGQNPYACKEFKQRAVGINREQVTTELKTRLKDSIVLKYRKQAEQNKITISNDTDEVFTRQILFPQLAEDRKRVSPDGVVSYIWFDPKLDKVTKTKKVETHGSSLNQIAVGGGSVNGDTPKSLCTKCGASVQYPHDAKTLQVTCWLCEAKEAFECANKKQKTPDPKPKEGKPNGKRSSIPRRKKSGRRNSRA